jgi:CubicO group peptidase (beta-lactamase class C family)
MTNSIFEMDASGVMVGSSYLYASGRDWARLGLLMLNGGINDGERLLPEGWTEAAHKPNTSNNDKRYGYQFWLNEGEDELRWPALPTDAYAMMGNRKQSVMIIPSEGVVFVRLGWSSGDYPMAANYVKLLSVLSDS